MSFGFLELTLTLLVGMGPLKATFVFIEATEHCDQKTRDRVALIATGTAVGTGLGLLFLGATIQSLLHFSIGALGLAGGLILLLFSLRIILSTSSDDHSDERDPLELATSPIGIPLILNPVGIVALVTFSAEAQAAIIYVQIAAVVLLMGVIDLVFLMVSGRIGSRMPHAMVGVIEKVFSILVAALAVEMMVDGASDLGVF